MALFSFALVGCSISGTEEVTGSGYENISVETLETMLDERQGTFLLVNTHIPFEGNIPDTDLSIPYNEITDNLDKLPGDKNAEIILYCRSDSMSTAAAADLIREGYTNVKNLVGGFNAWKDAGLPLEMEQ
jgi:rhodanese-related sulfurtransferase